MTSLFLSVAQGRFARLSYVALLVACTMAMDCRSERKPVASWILEFFDTPMDKQAEAMTAYSIEEQYLLYRHGVLRIHPPLFHLAQPIATRGTEAIPFLVERLEQSDNDTEKGDILYIFRVMHVGNHYDVNADRELMRILRNALSTMKEPAQGREHLEVITGIEQYDNTP